MIYLGDRPLASTIVFWFSTAVNGVATTLSGTPAVSIYKTANDTQVTTGVTLVADYDGVTGLNRLTIDTSDAFYATGKDFAAIITTGTIGGVSRIGEVLCTFSIDLGNIGYVKSASQTAGDIAALINTVDDFLDTEIAAIKTKTDQLTFSTANRVDSQVFGMQASVITATAIATDAITDAKVASDVTIASVTGSVNSVLGDVEGSVNGSVGSIATGGITAASFAADAITAAKIAADVTTELQSGLATAANLATVAGYIDTEVAAIKTQTDKFVFTVANKVDANVLNVNGTAASASNLGKTTAAIGRGTVAALSSTTSIITSAFSPAGISVDQFKGRVVLFDIDTTTTALRGQARTITGSTAVSLAVLTVDALTDAPVSGDTFSIV